MTDLVSRSGRCHGPGCERVISMWGKSEDFCDEECQTRWHAKWGAKMLVDERARRCDCRHCDDYERYNDWLDAAMRSPLLVGPPPTQDPPKRRWWWSR